MKNPHEKIYIHILPPMNMEWWNPLKSEEEMINNFNNTYIQGFEEKDKLEDTLYGGIAVYSQGILYIYKTGFFGSFTW